MNKKSYHAYLKSPHWKKTRLKALKRSNWYCEQCYETERLEVHHLTYKRLWHENLDDLMVLCRTCHQSVHDGEKVQEDDMDIFLVVSGAFLLLLIWIFGSLS